MTSFLSFPLFLSISPEVPKNAVSHIVEHDNTYKKVQQ